MAHMFGDDLMKACYGPWVSNCLSLGEEGEDSVFDVSLTPSTFALAEARANRIRFQDRLMLRLGDLLISYGLRLKARCQSNSVAPILRAD